MDTVVWGYIEKNILSAWFPAMLSENLRHISALEDEIRIGGKISNPSCSVMFLFKLLYRCPNPFLDINQPFACI